MSWTTMECKECGYEEDIVISYSHEWPSKVSRLVMTCIDCDPDAEVVEVKISENQKLYDSLAEKVNSGRMSVDKAVKLLLELSSDD